MKTELIMLRRDLERILRDAQKGEQTDVARAIIKTARFARQRIRRILTQSPNGKA